MGPSRFPELGTTRFPELDTTDFVNWAVGPWFGEQTFQWKDYFRWHCRVTRHVERLSLFNNNHSVLTYH